MTSLGDRWWSMIRRRPTFDLLKRHLVELRESVQKIQADVRKFNQDEEAEKAELEIALQQEMKELLEQQRDKREGLEQEHKKRCNSVVRKRDVFSDKIKERREVVRNKKWPKIVSVARITGIKTRKTILIALEDLRKERDSNKASD